MLTISLSISLSLSSLKSTFTYARNQRSERFSAQSIRMIAASSRAKRVAKRSFSRDFSPELERLPTSRNQQFIGYYAECSSPNGKSCKNRKSVETTPRKFGYKNATSETYHKLSKNNTTLRRGSRNCRESPPDVIVLHDESTIEHRHPRNNPILDKYDRTSQRTTTQKSHCTMPSYGVRYKRGTKAFESRSTTDDRLSSAIRGRSLRRNGKEKTVKFNERVRIVHYT